MTILNHAATGALVAATINRPWLSMPAALASHFLADAIPHWNYRVPGGLKVRNLAVLVDGSLALYLLLVLAVTVDASQRLIIAGGVLAVIPDLMWMRYRNEAFPDHLPKRTVMDRIRFWHQKIQWSETDWGRYVEIGWLVLTVTLIYQIHH